MKKITLLLLLAGTIAHAQLDLQTPSPLHACDDAPFDGFTVFDLTSKNDEITGGMPGFTVGYYETLTDAQNQGSIIATPTSYWNISAYNQTLYVRVHENASPSNFGITTLNIEVHPLPVAFPTAMMMCDDNADGFATFSLSEIVGSIAMGNPGLVVDFYETMADAQFGANPLPPFYVNIVPVHQVIYAGVYNEFGCMVVVDVDLEVKPGPLAPVVQNYVLSDGIPEDGSATFDLTSRIPEILAAQGGNPSQYEVHFFLTQADAEANTGVIFPANAFMNSTNPQTIWYRIVNTETGCAATGNFNLVVGTLGIGEHNRSKIEIAPNPTSDTVSIISDKTIDRVVLIDIWGRTILDRDISGKQATLDISQCAQGVYSLRISCENRHETRKLIKR